MIERLQRDAAMKWQRRRRHICIPNLHQSSIPDRKTNQLPPELKFVFVTPNPGRTKGAALPFTDQFAPTLRHVLSARSNGGRQDALNIYLADVALGQHGDERKL